MANEENLYPTGAKLPLAQIEGASRHLFLCVGPDCCDPAEHAALWDALKAATKRLNVPVLRTKAACLRICTGGPWLVIYPDGVWYGQLNEKRLHRILKEHIEENHPVTEWIAAKMPCLISRETPLNGREVIKE